MNRSFVSLGALALLLAAVPAEAGNRDDTLRWASRATVSSADPYYNEFREAVLIMSQMVWDTLVYRDPKDNQYKPLLAKSWRWVDNLTLDFDLRDDVQYHDGKPFTADDAVYTLNYVADPENKINVQSNANWMRRAEKLGEHKLRLHVKGPFPAALEYLSGPLAILPAGFYDNAGPSRLNVKLVGTGPYRFTRWEPGKAGQFEANRDYMAASPKGRAQIGRVEYRIIPDQATQLAEFLSGSIDWIWQVSKDNAAKLKNVPNVMVAPEMTMRVSFLAMDAAGRSGPNPFTDIRVRRAVNHAVDRETVVKNLIGQGSAIVHSACFPQQFGCTDDVVRYGYDPAKAKALLAEAGYPNGFDVDLWAYRERPWVEAAMGYLAQIGIRAKLNYVQYPVIRDKTAASSADVKFVDLSWGSYSINDASAFLNHWFTQGADDLSRDGEVKAWLDGASRSVDPAERLALYDKALKRIAEQAYIAPLYVNPVTYAYSRELDFTAWADENPRFFLAKWK